MFDVIYIDFIDEVYISKTDFGLYKDRLDKQVYRISLDELDAYTAVEDQDAKPYYLVGAL
jgi:hypothetical protein